MSRLVTYQRNDRVDQKGLAPSVQPRGEQGFEDYLERVAKYVPVEILAAFLLVRGVVEPGAIPPMVEIAIYAAFVVLTPLYLVRFGGDVPRKAMQVVIGTVSFLVWTYGIGGPFFFAALGEVIGAKLQLPGLGGVIVVLWALAVGLIKPEA